jgi:hypothetical protein
MSTTRDPSTDQTKPVPGAESVHDTLAERIANTFHDFPEWVLDEAVLLIEQRKHLGFHKYGTVLHAANGRDHWRDVIEELADAAAYAQCIPNTWLKNDTLYLLLDAIEMRRASQ